MEPKCLALLVNDAGRIGAWKLVGVYLSDAPIRAIMDVMRGNLMQVEETFDPVRLWENGLECSWNETEDMIADDKLPSMVYTITANEGAFVRQFRAIAMPMIGGVQTSYNTTSLCVPLLPEWAR